MDGFHFDVLVRSLTTAGSRRRALTGLLSGTLGLVGNWAEESAAKNCKKFKNKKKRKKCLAKAKTTTPTCIRSCAGKTCGDDGCGGSCGPCTGGSCSGGACVCSGGLVVCGSRCANGNGQLVSCPATGVTTACCSGNCRELVGTGMHLCQGRAEGDACEVPAHCDSNICTGGVCRCPSGKVACDGGCWDPCQPTQVPRQGSCGCCTTNDSPCGACNSCCCSGTCGAGGECTGRPVDNPCTFHAQCASGKCEHCNPDTNLCTFDKRCQP